MSDVLANFEAFEDSTVDGQTHTLTFNRKSRKLVITNDHATHHLTFKFNDSETAGILRGTESISLYFTTNQIIISGENIPYRVWVFG